MRRRVQLWFGPQHPGITGNMSVQAWLEGDTLTAGVTHVGYLHRGFEKLMERRRFIQSFPIVCRICVPEPDTNEYLLAAGLDELSGLAAEVPQRGRWIRTLVLEMSRLQMNLMTLGGHIGAMAMGAAPNWLIALRDLVLDRFEELTGGRIYHMFITYGGVRRDLPEGFAERMEANFRTIEEKLPLVDNVIFDSSVFRKRAIGVGVVPEEWVDEMSLSGPIVRAMGIPRDVRKDFPYEKYPELDFEVVTTTGSDIYARAWIRRQEIAQSMDLIRQIFRKMPEGPYCAKLPNMLTWTIPPGQTYVRAEATRGEMGYYVVTDGSDKIRRVHVRAPSYVHGVALLERMIPGTNIADLAPLMVSLQVCPPEMER
ncbi:MAG: NADH-quinone oxidoreductase subunit D [Acidobacteria bacterium]|nr:NADH-quinone oxidoreductase subunit D [Acidobacteriota bacterium]